MGLTEGEVSKGEREQREGTDKGGKEDGLMKT